MFDVTFLPATIGDSIWVRYGDPGNSHSILIDGGTRGTRKFIKQEIAKLPEPDRHVELMVVSHIDKDHLGGILSMLERNELNATVGDFWFNAWQHLPESVDDLDQPETLGAVQAEALTVLVRDQELPWNEAFGPSGLNPVAISEQGDLPVVTLPGGMKLTLLSPTLPDLTRLRGVWEQEVLEAGLRPGGVPVPAAEHTEDEQLGAGDLPDLDALADSEFEGDRSAANGSSIAFLAEFDGRRALFTADAHVPLLMDSLTRAFPGATPSVDLFKLSHHGSKGTVSKELVEMVDCEQYVFSTNGSIFRHPHAEAIARVVKGNGDDPKLIFNYRSDRNSIWEAIAAQNGYRTRYPEAEPGLTVSLT